MCASKQARVLQQQQQQQQQQHQQQAVQQSQQTAAAQAQLVSGSVRAVQAVPATWEVNEWVEPEVDACQLSEH